MEASISRCRTMRASQNAARAERAGAGQSSGASRGTSHSRRPFAGAGFPFGSSTVSAGAVKSTVWPLRAPRVTRNVGAVERERERVCVCVCVCVVQCGEGGFDGGLALLPDRVDLGVVGNGLEGDVGHALVHEALADVALGPGVLRFGAGESSFLALPLRAVGERVVGITRAHDPRAGEREGDARSVHSHPTPAPLFRDVCGRPRPAGGVENQIARIRGHENAATYSGGRCLHNVHLRIRSTLNATDVQPNVCLRDQRKVVKKTEKTRRASFLEYTPRFLEPFDSARGRLPVKSDRRQPRIRSPTPSADMRVVSSFDDSIRISMNHDIVAYVVVR